jgi:hypothetical protein
MQGVLLCNGMKYESLRTIERIARARTMKMIMVLHFLDRTIHGGLDQAFPHFRIYLYELSLPRKTSKRLSRTYVKRAKLIGLCRRSALKIWSLALRPGLVSACWRRKR